MARTNSHAEKLSPITSYLEAFYFIWQRLIQPLLEKSRTEKSILRSSNDTVKVVKVIAKALKETDESLLPTPEQKERAEMLRIWVQYIF